MAKELDGTVSLKEIVEITAEGDPLNLDQFKRQVGNVLGLIAQKNGSGGSLDSLNLQHDSTTLTSDYPKRLEFECYVLTLKLKSPRTRTRIYHLHIEDNGRNRDTEHLLVDIVHTYVDLPEEFIWKDIIYSLASFT